MNRSGYVYALVDPRDDEVRKRWDKIRAEGRYEEVCANIASGTKKAMNQGASKL